MKKIFVMLLITLISLELYAQSMSNKKLQYKNNVTILLGLVQPLILKGGNIEVNFTKNRMIFDYSHGFNLNTPTVGEMKTQGLELILPFSTGFGIGYRINSFLDIRIEPKLHSFEVYYKGNDKPVGNRIVDYKTFTLGAGVYYRYIPFRNCKLKMFQGITSSFSMRCWPNIGSTLSKDEFTYDNKLTGKSETMKASHIGFANTPLVLNMSIGYTFGGR